MKTNKKTRFGHLSYESEEDNSDGNWLISYADMMTLLWGFFVIVSAFSVPSKAIIEKIKETTSKSMGEVYVKPFNEISDELQSVLSELNLESDAQIENLTDGIKITMKSGKFTPMAIR